MTRIIMIKPLQKFQEDGVYWNQAVEENYKKGMDAKDYISKSL